LAAVAVEGATVVAPDGLCRPFFRLVIKDGVVANRPTSGEIVHLAHHAAGDTGLWDEVAKLLCRRLDAAYLAFVDHNFVTRQGRITHGSGFSPNFRSLYASRYAGQNAWLHTEYGFTPGQALTGAELVPNWELVRTDFYKSWLRPQKAFHCLLGVMLRRAEDIRCIIALRPLDTAAFSAEDKQTVAALLPQLGCASELDSHVTSMTCRSDVLEDVLGCLPEAVFVVDADCHPLVLNRAAHALIEQNDGLTLCGGFLGTCVRCETAELKQLIAHVAAQNGRGGNGVEMAVSRPSGEPPIVLTLTSLGHAAIDTAGRPANVATRRLCDFYRMTPAEARLAALIAGGRTLIEAATELHITTNTARTHMKRIYSKTVTRRQAELVRLLTSGFVQFN
jgi:DNA-binding CsgD family transcriptional regulator